MRADERVFWEPCVGMDSLWVWVKGATGLHVPRRAVCKGHCAPMEYLGRAYFGGERTMVVHGPRGGGKTRLGAVATLLDAVHRDEVAIRILGGSLEQSLRMWEYLAEDVEKVGVAKAKGKKIVFPNGSSVGVLAQSQRAVRGMHVQKLRCDEVEMFDREVWEAAQMSVKSKGGVVGSIEAMSTMHKAYGMMNEIVERAGEKGMPVVKWCILEVLEKCGEERVCGVCPLEEDCHGIAKTDCEGFFSIDDAIAIKQRVSLEKWQTEMLCRRPSVSGMVFPNFSVDVHVKEVEGKANWVAVDFGYANPFVCLWICDEGGVVKVIDEYVMREKTVEEHVKELSSRHGDVKRAACDPAGNGRNEQTGESTVNVLRRNGYSVKSRKSEIMDGVEKIRAGLCSGDRRVSLVIHPRCKQLIKAMRCYRLEEGKETPLKDGEHDHAIDALRYFFVNREGTGVSTRRY